MEDMDEVAVALRYDPATGGVPIVMARGRGAVARQIVAMAEAAGIPVRHGPDLARLLHRLELGCPIPVAAFAAVAEILAYLCRVDGELREAEGQGR